MKRKNITFICLSAVMSVIVCLQLVNHFVMLKETATDCQCSCDFQPSVSEAPVLEETLKKQRLLPRDVPKTKERKFSDNVDEMIQMLAGMNEVQQQSLGDKYDELYEILVTIRQENGESKTNWKKSTTIPNTETQALTPEVQEICPEKFMGDSLTYGYPFFRKGFATLNCTQFVPIHELVTLVFDDVHTSRINPPAYKRVLKGLAKYHPKMNVVYITRDTRRDVDEIKSNVKVVRVKQNEKQGEVWSKALTHVTTKYVLIAPHLVEFDDDINLKRLVRILSHNPDAAIVSGAYRTRNGHWDIGCQQSRFLNYTLTLQGGYYISFWECVVCDFIPGPWLARTRDLKEMELDENLDFGVFHDIFWRVKKEKRIALSCPDVMFNIDRPEVRDEWYLELSKKYDIRKIVEPSGQVRWYGCRRGIKHKTGRSCSKPRGVGVPPCDLENLADAIKMIMRECENAGLFCELQEGTLLGAVKFNKVLPWERDADLTFLTANYTAFKALGPVFRKEGYSFSAHDSSIWCCADGRKAGGKFTMSADGWNIELYGQHLMESEILVARGEKPTKVDFAGEMVTVVRNPGLFARNRYGKSLYRHQEHWLDRGKTSGWHFYNPGVFEGCPTEGHSGCLNQYSIDGNMQFDMNICPCTYKKPLR